MRGLQQGYMHYKMTINASLVQESESECLLVIRPKTIIHQDLSIEELVPSPH